MIEIATNHDQQLAAHPLESTSRLTRCTALESAQLFGCISTYISLGMMLGAQGDHAVRIVVLPLRPRRIEVVPIQVRITAPVHGTTETDLSAKLLPDLQRWCPVHPH